MSKSTYINDMRNEADEKGAKRKTSLYINDLRYDLDNIKGGGGGIEKGVLLYENGASTGVPMTPRVLNIETLSDYDSIIVECVYSVNNHDYFYSVPNILNVVKLEENEEKYISCMGSNNYACLRKLTFLGGNNLEIKGGYINGTLDNGYCVITKIYGLKNEII